MPKKPPCSPDEMENPRTHFCVKLAGKIGKAISKLAQNIQQKNCPPEQVLNPKTGRCVKQDGKIGMALAKAPVAPAPARVPCPENTILNPKTGKCVKRDGKIGMALLKAPDAPKGVAAKAPPFKHYVTLKAANQNVAIVAITFSLAGPKVLHIARLAPRTFTTIQDLLRAYNKAVEQLVNKGYTVVKVVGNPHKALENAIDSMKACMRKGPADVKPKKAPTFTARDQCQNQDTMIMMDDIMTVPLGKRFKTQDGYCFDIEELAQSIVASNTVNNPITRQIMSEDDIKAITRHEGIDFAHRSKIGLIYEQLLKNGSTLETLYRRNPKLVTKFIRALNMAAITCVADYTDDFTPSQNALSCLGDVMSRFEGADLVAVQQLKNYDGTNSLSGIINSANYTCIHGIGYSLCCVFLHSYATLKEKGMAWLPPLEGIKEITDKGYIFLYNAWDENTKASVNFYDPKSLGKMVRIGRVTFNPSRSITMFEVHDAHLIMMHKAQQTFDEMRPQIQALLDDQTTIVYRTKDIKALGKVMAKL